MVLLLCLCVPLVNFVVGLLNPCCCWRFAQISLRFGADDMDGTVIEEKIYHDAGATTPQGMRREELERLIRAAGREPIERDTLYRPVTRTDTSVTVAV